METPPWDAYWEALEVLQLAERVGCPEGVEQARREADEARLSCSLLGGFLLCAALESNDPRLSLALKRLTGESYVALYDLADRALKLALRLEERVNELEKRLDVKPQLKVVGE